MKSRNSILLFFTLIIFSCQKPIHKKEYKLLKLDSYDFRRNYFGNEKLTGKALDSFFNRNPEQCDKCREENRGEFYDALVKNEIIEDQALNLHRFDTLSEHFIYNFSKEKQFSLDIDYLEYSKGIIETPSYLLTFKDENKIIKQDTLQFEFPPDVIFNLFDSDNDGKDELYSLFIGYVINGHNYYLDVYTLK